MFLHEYVHDLPTSTSASVDQWSDRYLSVCYIDMHVNFNVMYGCAFNF